MLEAEYLAREHAALLREAAAASVQQRWRVRTARPPAAGCRPRSALPCPSRRSAPSGSRQLKKPEMLTEEQTLEIDAFCHYWKGQVGGGGRQTTPADGAAESEASHAVDEDASAYSTHQPAEAQTQEFTQQQKREITEVFNLFTSAGEYPMETCMLVPDPRALGAAAHRQSAAAALFPSEKGTIAYEEFLKLMTHVLPAKAAEA